MCLATLACSFVLAAPGPAYAPLAQGKPGLEVVLASWNRRYRSGKLELDDIARTGMKDARFYGNGHLPPHRPAYLSHADALDHLLERALETPSIEICREVLSLATVGIDAQRLPPHRLAARVRVACLTTLGKLRDPVSLDFIYRIANGRREAWAHRRWHPAIQATALKSLGRTGNNVFRPTLEEQLDNETLIVQIGAADALGIIALARSLPSLTGALEHANNSQFCQALIQACMTIIDSHAGTLGSVEIRDALTAAISRLGQGDWRSDLAVIRMLEKYRSLAAIPALIGVLERFDSAADLDGSDKLSGLLQHRAYELLSSMTGALLPMQRTDLWREFWQRERVGFALASVPDRSAFPPRTQSGFFGIPVVGLRLVYVIDTSGSMKRSHISPGRSRDSRLHLAKRELRSSIFALPKEAEFALVSFADQASRWRSKLTKVTNGSRNALVERLKNLRAEGGTNIYAALITALAMRGSGRDRYRGSPVEEIFLLSDGEPSVGVLVQSETILEAIADANSQLQVTINTIYIGGGDSKFMRKLAEQNRGRYVSL